MKPLMAVVGVFIGIAAAFVAWTYPSYRRQMRGARTRLLAGSTILKTAVGKIEYSVGGEGTPVLLLHGAGGGYDQGLWLGRLALGDGYKLISVSRYGYLRSPLPSNPSLKTQAALYRDLLDHLNIQKVVVVGGSAGGPSATQFANDFPSRTSALILISAVSMASAAGDKPPFLIGIIHLIQHSDYAYWLAAKYMRPAILSLMGISAELYGRFSPSQKNVGQEMLDTMHPMTERYAGTINDGRMIQRQAPSADTVSAPTLILHAKDDALVSYHHALYAHEVIKGSQLVCFDAGGHGLLPVADEVKRNVKEFLEQSLGEPAKGNREP